MNIEAASVPGRAKEATLEQMYLFLWQKRYAACKYKCFNNPYVPYVE
jgi:hypothetical protein